jgi:cholesterol oxidase
LVSAAAQADIVIVGSGFGGAVAACRLAAPNRTVVVLERGRRWHADALPYKPSDFIYSSKFPHRLNGLLDVRVLDRMVVGCGAGVGGGSLVYANVCVDAPPAFFRTGWPSQITHNEMVPYYAAVTKMIAPQPIPKTQHNPRMELLRTAANNIGAGDRYIELPLAINFDHHVTGRVPGKPWQNPNGYAAGTCVHCGNCCIGCHTGAKKTLDQNYLQQAEANDVHIQPLSMVTHLSADRGGRWRVHYLDTSAGQRRPQKITCRVVILAAGSLGSTEILLRTRDEFGTVSGLPRALGRGWSPNGDFLTLARYPGRELEPTKGPTIGAVIDFLSGVDQPDDNLVGVDGQLYVEDGGLPNLAEALLASWKDVGGWKQKIYENAEELAEFRSMIPWFGQSIDAADGEFALRSRFVFWRRRLRLNWNPQLSMQALDTFGDMHVAMTLATGGVPIPLFTWKRLRMLVTPHPLGGANMGSAPGVGVVDHLGEVFGHKNLFVMDGAVIPRAIGRNPSKTIAAIAERCCDRLAERLDREHSPSSGPATSHLDTAAAPTRAPDGVEPG